LRLWPSGATGIACKRSGLKNWLEKIRWNLFVLWHASHEKRLPYHPLEDIVSIQNRRVRAIVSHAYETVPYYRRVMDEADLRPGDFRSAEDLSKLPVLTRDQLARDPGQFISNQYQGNENPTLHTTGTSGHSKSIRYDPRSLFLSLACGYRQRLVMERFTGRHLGYREMSMAVPSSVIHLLRKFYESRSYMPRGVELVREFLVPDGRFDENIRKINAFKPDVIFGYGSYMGLIYRWAWENGVDVFIPKLIWYGADHVSPTDRRLIETEFGIPVYSTYQATEALRIAFQCERREGFHLNLDQVAVRIVDNDNKDLPPGRTGDIVISNLTNRATVLLNYKLGDVVTLSPAPCPCGRTLPVLERIDGRSDDTVIRPNGWNLFASIATDRLSAIPGLVQIQLVQEDLQRFHLLVVCANESDWENMLAQLDDAIRSVLGNDIVVRIDKVQVIPQEPGGKVRSFISKYAESPVSH
jgi:phenylacetate-CoA ligase